MKNKKMFIILSIVALSASIAHANEAGEQMGQALGKMLGQMLTGSEQTKEVLKNALEQTQAAFAEDQSLNEHLEAIANKAQTFKMPSDIKIEKAQTLAKQWKAETEQLPAFNQLIEKASTKIKGALDANTLQALKKYQSLVNLSEEFQAEVQALQNSPKYKSLLTSIGDLLTYSMFLSQLLNAVDTQGKLKGSQAAQFAQQALGKAIAK